MVTMRDYAESKGISYEAVRQQVKRYRDDLSGHIETRGRTQYLDDYAVAYLDERRRGNPVVVVQEATSEELDELREENKKLLLKVTELQDRLLSAQEQLVTAAASELLLEDRDKHIEEQAQEIDHLRDELENERAKSWVSKLLRKS